MEYTVLNVSDGHALQRIEIFQYACGAKYTKCWNKLAMKLIPFLIPFCTESKGIDRYDHTDTDIPVWIHIKLIPIYLFGFISNQYRYIWFSPYKNDTDTNNQLKLILTDYLQILP